MKDGIADQLNIRNCDKGKNIQIAKIRTKYWKKRSITNFQEAKKGKKEGSNTKYDVLVCAKALTVYVGVIIEAKCTT